MEVPDVVALAAATGDEDAHRALAAAAELRRAAELMEAEVVRRARVGGLSWKEIAGCLGVTRQAVHKKHGRA